GMVVGSPLLSHLSGNVFHARKPVLVMCGVIVVILTGLLAFFTDQIPLTGHYFLCLSLGLFSSAVVVIGFTMNKEMFPVQIAGTATGLVNLFPFAGGAVFQPVLGYALERQGRVQGEFTLSGYENAFFILFICALVAFISSLFVKETLKTET
ncbi:MAG: MFS transporter, partial [Desulfobacterales bacterium]|nr:MFS transporter [Desulfobacterales bacterium]